MFKLGVGLKYFVLMLLKKIIKFDIAGSRCFVLMLLKEMYEVE